MASPSRLPCADAAAYRSCIQNPRTSSSHQDSHPCYPTSLPPRESSSSFSWSHPLLGACSLQIQAPLAVLFPTPPLSPPSIQNKLSTWGLFKDLPPGVTCLFTASSRRGEPGLLCPPWCPWSSIIFRFKPQNPTLTGQPRK